MNTAADNGNDDLRHAEYVLGVLDADARAAVAHEIETDPVAAAAVAAWQIRLAPLADEVAETAPADYVWARIRDALALDTVAKAQPRKGLWNDLRFWHWLGIGASVIAAACLVVMVIVPRWSTQPAAVGASYMTASIEQDNGVTGWTATMDLQHARMIVVPATPVAFARGRVPELWLIPPGAKPISLGVIGRDTSTTVKLDPALLAQLSAKALLAVSVEPTGGSPTGQPTGAVIAKGAISGA
ncbi:MAG TPA: anti-sigma factor [Rhodanobacteraceae bacterium]|nr:anti-sigma factor [Rhodanobacteraceae bacterium]